jgi:hypothetical protein
MSLGTMAYRKYLPLALTSLAGIMMLLEYFTTPAVFGEVASFFRSVSSRSVGLGIITANITLFYWNYLKIGQAKTTLNKGFATLTLGMGAIYVLVALGIGIQSDFYLEMSKWTWTGISYAVVQGYPLWLLFGAYRALRIRSLEGMGLLIAAFAVIFTMAPWSYMYISPATRGVDRWISANIAQPVMAALLMGSGIGGAAAALRTIIWKERMYVRVA